MSRFLFVLGLALAVLAIATAGGARCPNILGKKPFDGSKFRGVWHIIAGADTKLDGIRCVKANLDLPESDKADYEVVTGAYTAIVTSSNKPVKFEQYLQMIGNDKSALMNSVFKQEGTAEWSQPFKSSVIATDYENYAVVISCQPKFDAVNKTFGRTLTGKILGRSNVLNKDIISTLTNLLSGYDIDPATVRMVDHTDCDAPQTPVHHASRQEAAN